MRDRWHGLYGEGWGNSIVPDAFSHPAKFRPALIRYIYDHMLGEGWLKPGDRVLDPFGGVALGALHAMHNGLHFVGVELEARFVALGNANIDLWNERYGPLFPGWGTAVLLQGDSRKLLGVLRGEVDGCVSSPPYAETQINPGNALGLMSKRDRTRGHTGDDSFTDHGLDGYGATAAQLGAMPAGDFAAAVASPPYQESLDRGTVNAAERRKLARSRGISNAEYISPIDMENIGKRSQPDYGETVGQLGAMPEGEYQAAVSSPPFGAAETRDQSPYQGGFVGDMMGRAYTQSRQGETDGNLGGMETKVQDFEAVVSSPPFEDAVGSDDPDKRGGLYRDPKRRGDVNLTATYGDTDGQLGAMRGGFEGAVSSPPYEASRTDTEFQRQAANPEVNLSMPESTKGYGDSGIGRERTQASIDTFWSAARTIVEQVYAVLAPGAHAVWITKRFVRDGEIVDFPGQWRQLCEAVGFVTLHEHHAMLGEDNGTQLGFFEDEHLVTERKSFFRRLAESKGSPPIDWETVWCMEKPEQAALWEAAS